MTTDQPSFSHQDVFPIIAKVIDRRASLGNDFVTHDEIVSEVMSDPEGALLVEKAMANSKLGSEAKVAANMIAWFSQQITTGKSMWGPYFDRRRQGGTWAYRTSTSAPTALHQDLEISAIEGNPLLFFHIRRERDANLRKEKLEAVASAGLPIACEACGTTTAKAFPGLTAEILEVHHRLPLAEVDGQVVTKLEDLALLCPNCHRAIHRTKPLSSIGEFRARFELAKK